MPTYRSSYHYGNLRAALADAALDLARRGGPAAVTVRGVARSVGVTPPAAYRHFAEVEELLGVTKSRALALLAERVDAALGKVALVDECAKDCAAGPSYGAAGREASGAGASLIDGVAPREYSIAAAAACLRTAAEAYVDFAKSSPGLFAMACHGSPDAIRLLVTDRVGPFLAALSARRPGMVFALWSAVHALAVLAAEGASRDAPRDLSRDVSQDEVLDTVLAWIAGSARPARSW